MSPEHRLATAAKLVTEVLASVTDGTLPLSEPACGEALVDALWVLASPDMKIFTPPNKTGKGASAAEDDVASAEARCRPLTQFGSLIHSLVHSSVHSLVHSLVHWSTQPPTHSLARRRPLNSSTLFQRRLTPPMFDRMYNHVYLPQLLKPPYVD